MALITTLIPAYKKEFLAETFLGLRQQNLRDFRIILSDDSPGAEITGLLNDGHYSALLQGLDLQVVRGPSNARRNHEYLLELWDNSTPLVHFQLDDDVIYPDFYRHHVLAHSVGGYGLTVSRRWISGPDGRPAASLQIPENVAMQMQRMSKLDPNEIFGSSIPFCDNWLGELSNMVIAREAAALFPRPPAHGVSYYGVMDLGLVFEVARQHPVGYLHEHLSIFRRNAGQTTNNVHSHTGRVASLCWIAYALAAWKEGRINQEQAVQGIGLCTRRCMQQYGEHPAMAPFFALFGPDGGLEAFHDAFATYWTTLLASHPATHPTRPPVAATPPRATRLAA